MKFLAHVFAVVTVALISLPALAATPVSVPEPGALALLSIGAGSAAIVWARKRNKK